jgi:hypothetical protein
MQDLTKGRFLTGPVRTEANAKKIIGVGSVAFLSLSLLCILTIGHTFGDPRLLTSRIAGVVTFGGLGSALFVTKSRIVSWTLLGVNVLGSALILYRMPEFFGAGLILRIYWSPFLATYLFLSWLSWRAVRATMFLHHLKQRVVVEVFS